MMKLRAKYTSAWTGKMCDRLYKSLIDEVREWDVTYYGEPAILQRLGTHEQFKVFVESRQLGLFGKFYEEGHIILRLGQDDVKRLMEEPEPCVMSR